MVNYFWRRELKIRTKIFLGYIIIVAIGFYFYADRTLKDTRQRYLESIEEDMVDTANILSCIMSEEVRNGGIGVAKFRNVFKELSSRELDAKIYGIVKKKVNMTLYITDSEGVVIFDPNQENIGKDYSEWIDVNRTLKGRYGARATRINREDPSSQILYVAAPIMVDGKTYGVVTVCKPVKFIYEFITNAKLKIIIDCLVICLAVMILGLLVSAWLTAPIQKLTDYTKAVTEGKNPPLPKLGGGEMRVLGKSFSDMKEALEGKKYVENYVQTLAHELKSPISAVKGALEILRDNPPPEKQKKFLENIRQENDRMQNTVEKMLELSSLESRRELKNIQNTDIVKIAESLVASFANFAKSRDLNFVVDFPEKPLECKCEGFLVSMALNNLIQNAVDFTPPGKEIKVRVYTEDEMIVLEVANSGPEIPDYAMKRLFEKFYSLPRPDSGKKSSGLGLSIAKEVAELHGGKISVSNLPEGGVKAVISIPV